MENNIVQKSDRGKTVLLDSDYRGGAILYSFTAILLLAYGIINSILWRDVTLKPTQGVTYNGAISLFIISIIVSIFAGVAFIYSIYKLIITQEQRDKIAKSFYSWASKPSGVNTSSSKIGTEDLKNIPIETPDTRGRDIFATGQLTSRQSAETSFRPVETQLDLSGF